MKFNVKKFVEEANKLSHPNQGIGMLLNFLAKENSAEAKNIMDMIKGDKDPVKVIEKFSSDGKIKYSDFNIIKKVYGMAKKAGLKKFDVPQSVWDKAESALKKNTVEPKNNDWF